MRAMLPYLLLFLGFAATGIGVFGSRQGKIDGYGLAALVVAAMLFIGGAVKLFMEPPQVTIRLSKDFDSSGWLGKISPGERVEVTSLCDFAYLRDADGLKVGGYDRLSVILDEIWQLEGRFAISVDYEHRRLVRARDFPKDLSQADIDDLVRQALQGARRIFDDGRVGYKVHGRADTIDPMPVYSTLAIFFPEAVFGEASSCNGRIVVEMAK